MMSVISSILSFTQSSLGTIVLLALSCIIYVRVAVEDWHTCEVSGIWCLAFWMQVWLLYFLPLAFGGLSLVSMCIIFILFLLYWGDIALPLFGDADIIAVALYIAIFGRCFQVAGLVILWPVNILVLLIPYGKLWGRVHKQEWYFGCGALVPALPCFAVGWVLMVVELSILCILRGGSLT